jgi:ABC-2 type transport system ATP-binding protein
MDAASATRASASWLERLGLAQRARDKVEALSLGNQQRVQLAAALLHEPTLLVLDEPFSGLDPVGVDDLAGVLAERARAGATVLFSSHQLDLVEHICDSVAIVNRGRCVAAGKVRELVQGADPRLVVAVGDDPSGEWARGLTGVDVRENNNGMLRLTLAAGVDPQRVLAAAMARGAVDHFGFESQRLSGVFREAVAEPAPGARDDVTGERLGA